MSRNFLNIAAKTVAIIILLSVISIMIATLITNNKKKLKEQENLLLQGRTYLTKNRNSTVNLKTLIEYGYIDEIENCDMKKSTITYKNQKYYLELICNNKTETLILSY